MTDDWTLSAYVAHNEALRVAEDKFQTERDRRYAEVRAEADKAIQIKESADLAALQLAREIQSYKDEKANELREQINAERGLYPTRTELLTAIDSLNLQIRPLAEYVASQQGRSSGLESGWKVLIGAVGLFATIVSLVLVFTAV